MESKTALEIKSPLKHAICEFKKLGISIKKESDNPFFKSKYADLANILDAVEAEAAKFGLLITSRVIRDENGLTLVTELEHKNSDEVKSTLFPLFGNKPQEIGSSITYARRYNIQCLLNLAAEDDDGNSANDAQVTQPTSGQFKSGSVFSTGGERRTSGTEILAQMNACETSDELNMVKEDYRQDINRFKISKNPQDKEFYDQIIARGKYLSDHFIKTELNDEIPTFEDKR